MKRFLPVFLALALCAGCATTPFDWGDLFEHDEISDPAGGENAVAGEETPDDAALDSPLLKGEPPDSEENPLGSGPFFVEASWGFSMDGCGGGVIHDQPGSRFKAGRLTEVGIGATTRPEHDDRGDITFAAVGLRWHDYSMYVKQKGFRYGMLRLSSVHLTLQGFIRSGSDSPQGFGLHVLLSAGGGTAHFTKSGLLRWYDSSSNTHTDIEHTGEVVSGAIGIGIDFYFEENSSISLEYRYLEGWVSMDWKIINGPSAMLDDFSGMTMKQIHQIVLAYRIFF
jgi:hypothetical protein